MVAVPTSNTPHPHAHAMTAGGAAPINNPKAHRQETIIHEQGCPTFW